ncbi:glycosyltransferase, exosortase A system-associated [Thioalkalivibrio denitrificans]|uniref:Glycosyltransferase, exosortase A system-associated n=1 Tax=Thioalkalivibrio denitrificans TaxID=108003 RepID=A0A1V3NPD5_9GAMM|nr:TIGR04063 family PEP-CTERM/XrtA system glycosyltransferase [Thioalkalivibrio denitrificans]OOG26823.1 glycosyltransferase, exosortase A system-associated [Thioalkalivibrio denitrificans]
MKILHILDHSIPLHSGYTFRTAAILREQRKLGWETFHLTSPKHLNPQGEEETVDGLHFYRTLYTPKRLPGLGEWWLIDALARRLEMVAREIRPDVLHAHSPALNAMAAIRVGRRLGIPVVYEVRAFWEDAAVDHGTSRENGLRYRLTRGLETYAFRRVDHITTICEGLRQDIIARGVPASRITVIPNAVDIERFRWGGEANPELRSALGLDGCRVLGFIGSFYAYEGLKLLLEAYPRIREQAPDVRILLVGGGVQEHNLRQQAQSLGIADHVIFTGRVPHERVQDYYNLVDLLVYPRLSMRLTELVTPLKPLESMAQGRLLVASDVGGHKELIRDGETGWLFRAGNAEALAEVVLRTLSHPEQWESVRAAGRRFVEEERNWAASVARYRRAYGLENDEGEVAGVA